MNSNFHRMLIVPLAILFACNPKPVGVEPFTPLDALLVLPLSVNMITGTTAQLGAQRFKDGTGTDKTASTVWASQNTNVVTVSSKGRLTAVNPGRTTVKGTVDGVSASVQVVVEAPGLQLLPITMSLEYQPVNKFPDGGIKTYEDGGTGEFYGSDKFVANLLADDGSRSDVSDQMLWGSSDPSIAEVTDGGRVTAVSEGEATITGIYKGQTVTGTVSVSEVPFE